MPKIGMEPIRRRALIDAAILAIGERGSLDVTMSDIAGRAGVSTALAHHYFGGKEDLLHAAMRHILAELGGDLRRAVAGKQGIERVEAVIAVNFSHKQFQPEIVSAWLAFYVEAQHSTSLRRLLRIYARRLHSNLLYALRPIMRDAAARRAAEGIAALIDGLYIRRALKDGPPDAVSASALVQDYLELQVRADRSS
ncbi:transcriptional regulator BetI [Nitratireductor thuwali]|uniref:HTH-type transcriptional regulator BetI n=1 Tax=Nitratireductor thuwali TaxID=2267699 RepID=A0ABY5MSP5_9HYPH|nr:HTH-type transcriptional regulator BetI [Nitratireductor thuwali]